MKSLERRWRRAALRADIARGVRAAIVMLGPFYFAVARQERALVWAALAGWLATLGDPGGARRTRAMTLTAFVLLGAVVLMASEGSARIGPLFAMGVLALVTASAALLGAVGGTASTVGTLLTVIAAVATSRPSDSLLADALAFLAGGATATFLSTIVWPVWTHLPVRRALAEVFDALAAYAHGIDALAEAPGDDPRWIALARKQRREVRARIDAARAAVLAVRSRRGGESRFGANLRVLLGSAEAELALLVTFTEDVEALAPAARPRRVARALADRWLGISRVLSAPDPTRATLTLEEIEVAPHPPIASRLLEATRDSVLLAAALDRPGPSPPGEFAARPTSLRDDVRTLRDALMWRSPHARHALRAAAAVSAALLLGQYLSPEQPHWVTVTTLTVLQTTPSTTVKRATERVLGTILGSLAAAAITLLVRPPWALALTLVPLSVASVATRPFSYRLFTFFFTPVFVILAEQRTGNLMLALTRAGDAVAGGAIALAAAVLVFPAWEEERLGRVLRETLDAVAAYADVVLAGGADILAARRKAGASLDAAESSLERLLSEPRIAKSDASTALAFVTYARRLSGALTALATDGRPIDDASKEVRRYVCEAIAFAQAKLPPAAGALDDPRSTNMVASAKLPDGGALSRLEPRLERIVKLSRLFVAPP